ncbi:MAG: type II secretion system protein GspK [Parvularculaceae bacterium]|nr:type II secretion system protein GspK [Parvularculaceae bacterium]
MIPAKGMASNDRQIGAALPMVLVTISLLALLTASSFNFLSRASNEMAALETRSAAERAIASAQAEALFAFLTAWPTPGGLDLRNEPEPESEPEPDAALVDEDLPRPGTIWRGDGVWRRAATDPVAVVSYRDGAGLLAIPAASLEIAAAFLEQMGVDRETAARLASRLADFQDEDFVRRFQGGERADYRISKRRPPTNAPIRNAEELSAVIGFETLSPQVRRRIVDNAIFPVIAPPLKAALATPALAPMVKVIESADPLALAANDDLYPSSLARFTVAAPAGETILLSTVDIERTAAALDAPYRTMTISRHAVALDGLDGGAEGEWPGMEFAAARLYQNDERSQRVSAYELDPISATQNPETEQ